MTFVTQDTVYRRLPFFPLIYLSGTCLTREKMLWMLFYLSWVGLGVSFEDDGVCTLTAWDINICSKGEKISGIPDLIITNGGEGEKIKGSPRMVICYQLPCIVETKGGFISFINFSYKILRIYYNIGSFTNLI